MWWYTPIILALGRLRQENGEVRANLSYIEISCLKNKSHKINVKGIS
jgi:hypothetical protein